MGKIIIEYLEGRRIYICKQCSIPLSNADNLRSKLFTGQSGKAFLFDKGINYLAGKSQTKELRTGKHTTQDISCIKCHHYLGWKYIHAFNPSEKYKEGKIILERAFLEKIKWSD